MRSPRPRDDRGATSAEYSLLAVAIAAVVVVIVVALGQHVTRLYDHGCTSAAAQAATTETCD